MELHCRIVLGDIMNIKAEVLVRAYNEAKDSTVRRGKIGAVLFTTSGRVLCSAHNVQVDMPNKYTIHAEEYLLARAFRLKALSRFRSSIHGILVVRYRLEDGGLGMAMPCPKCHKLLQATGLRVYFSNKSGDIDELKS